MGERWTELRLGPLRAPVILWLLVALFLVVDVVAAAVLLPRQPPGMDFLPLWTAAKADPSRLYDFHYITGLQTSSHEKLRPFIYPPSTLVGLWPFGLLPFQSAYLVFIVAGAALFAWAAKRLGADWRLALIVPPAFLAVVTGQMTLLIGGLVMAAISLPTRPLVAGLLYGLAGAMKPQMLVLLPLALIAERNWKAFASTGLTAALVCAGSLATGASWVAWIEALPRFGEVVRAHGGFVEASVSPYFVLGWPGIAVALPVALTCVWLAFRSEGQAVRVLALLAGALAVSPYALKYELAMLAPAVLASRSRLAWPVMGLLGISLSPHMGIIALAGVMALVVYELVARTSAGSYCSLSSRLSTLPMWLRGR